MTSRLLSFINQSRTIFSADQIDNTVFLIGHSIHIIRLKSLNRKKKLYPQDDKYNFISYFFYFSTPQKETYRRGLYLEKKTFELDSFFYKDSSALNFQQICKELLVQLIHITQLPGYTVVQNYTIKYNTYIKSCIFLFKCSKSIYNSPKKMLIYISIFISLYIDLQYTMCLHLSCSQNALQSNEQEKGSWRK